MTSPRNTVAAIAWTAGALLFTAFNIAAQAAWKTPYSLRNNNISDLGNRYCRYTGSDNPPRRYICSPIHTAFDAAMVVTGLLLAAGALLTTILWRRGGLAWVARILIAVGGFGYVLAGIWPADIDLNLHVLGAFLLMGGGNVGLLLAGFAARPPLRWPALILGLAALAATVLHFGKHYLGLGMGGSERIAVFALPLWALLSGAYLLKRR
jgi:hypothetical membrane protein